MPPMKQQHQPLRLGIIGAGLAVEQLHWPALRQLEHQFLPVAVADVEAGHAEHIATLTGASKQFRDYRDLLRLDEIDAVLIALPIHLQARVILDCVHAGKHVLCEKPPASNLQQAQELMANLAGTTQVVAIAENFRYRQDLDVAKKAIADERIGALVMLRCVSVARATTDDPKEFSGTPWRHDTQYRGGPLLDGGVHHAAALRDIGGPVEWVQAFTKYGGGALGGTTSMVMSLRFRNGVLGSFTHSSVVHDPDGHFLNLMIYGSEGTLQIHDGSVRLLRSNAEPEDLPVPEFDNGYRGEFEDFFQAVRTGKPVRASLAESYGDLELIMRALDSAEQASVLLL
ncbi:MAG: Gfo/Idh/MocA family oxidoreductase [Herpetosiphon sp.]